MKRSQSLKQVKKRFLSGAYEGLPIELINMVREEIAKDQKYWDEYIFCRSGVLARIYQTRIHREWVRHGTKLYWDTCEKLDALFLGEKQ